MPVTLRMFLLVLANILFFAIFVRAILSWFPVRGDNPVIAILYQVTEPILAPLRAVIPRIGMIDITPMVASLILIVIIQVLS